MAGNELCQARPTMRRAGYRGIADAVTNEGKGPADSSPLDPGRAILSQSESLVCVGRDFLALGDVGRKSADIRHKYPRLARDVRPDVPGTATGTK